MALKQKGRPAAKQRESQARQREHERELAAEYRPREPKAPTAFQAFTDGLSDEQRPFATTYWHMQCDHQGEKAIAGNPHGDGYEPVWMRCPDCGLLRRWHGSRTATKSMEWMSYCPDGFDMFEWEELFTRDRSMWMFLHDEALASMVDESMTREV